MPCTRDLGLHKVDLPSSPLTPATVLSFTFFWHEAERWEGVDVAVVVG